MSASSEPGLLRRLTDLELELERRSSERVERHHWGRLILNPATAAIWRDNFLEVRSTSLDADQIARLADDHLGRRGLDHRFVVPADPAYGEELAPGFRKLGWQVDRSVYMVRRRPADREVAAAVEVDRDEIEAVRRAVARSLLEATTAAVEQRLIRDARLDRVANGRWFAAPAEGPAYAACVLYELDGIGQVETVGTAPEHRGRGLASAVVLAAAEASRRAEHGVTFIVADAEDWPWKLYERLGFNPVGEACAFLRKPDQPVSEG